MSLRRWHLHPASQVRHDERSFSQRAADATATRPSGLRHRRDKADGVKELRWLLIKSKGVTMRRTILVAVAVAVAVAVGVAVLAGCAPDPTLVQASPPG